MNLPVALGTLAAVVLVQLAGVESEWRTCYFGRPPAPLPGERWRQAAAREIRKRCPGMFNSTMNHVVTDEAKPFVEVEISSTPPAAPRFADCRESLAGGVQRGVVTIYPPQYPNGLNVNCAKTWMIIHSREDGSVNFTRSWAEYRDGFGDLTGEFWLGNEVVRRLTSEGTWELHVFLKNTDNTKIKFAAFQIEGDNYIMRVKRLYMWQVAYWLSKSLTDVSLGQPFSTYDRDNDADDNANCAAELMGGWWFKTCTGGIGDEDLVPTNLNGEYSYPVNYTGHDYRGIRWAGDAL